MAIDVKAAISARSTRSLGPQSRSTLRCPGAADDARRGGVTPLAFRTKQARTYVFSEKEPAGAVWFREGQSNE